MITDIPKYQVFFDPILQTLQNQDNFLHLSEISDAIGNTLKLSDQQLNQYLPSGRQTVFENKLQWAISYLESAMFIDSDGQSAYRISPSAQTLVKSGNKINFNDASSRPSPLISSNEELEPASTQSYQAIHSQVDELYAALKQDVLERVLSNNPAFFENLIIDLLLAMGYGKRRRDLTAHLGGTGDGGIDGAINQDQLGLDVVYIQAKRYKPGSPVPVSAVRDFAGAIEAHKANKGVFVTTTTFTKSGKQFIERISKRIVLIDGERLCELLIRNNIGVRIQETLEIKRIDEDYFV